MSASLLDRLNPRRGTAPRRARSPRFAGAVALCLVALLAGCGDDDGGTSAGAGDDAGYEDMTGESAVEIDTRDNTFGPELVTVSAGTEVTWNNRGRTAHNVIPSEEGQFEDVPVDQLQPGDTASRTFDEPGEYPYYCSLHGTPTAGMVGSIRVVEG